jgi:uridine kinase
VCERIIEQLDSHRVDRISLDSFYLPLTAEQLDRVSEYNWDHPAALDWDLIARQVLRATVRVLTPLSAPLRAWQRAKR